MNLSVRVLIALLAVAAACVSTAIGAAAQDSALGTFTVGGKTVRFTQVYASLETSPSSPSESYLILLVSDLPIAAADRSPARLTSLASTGKLHAVRLLWRIGFDDIAVVPYHSGVAESGRAFASMSTVNLSALDEKRVNAEFKSKMLGQTWFFNAIVKAAIAHGNVATLEPAVDAPLPPAPNGTPGKSDPTAIKRALGAMGYEFTPAAFFQAIADSKAQAVTLFIQAGMTPNQKDQRGEYALNYSVLFCHR